MPHPFVYTQKINAITREMNYTQMRLRFLLTDPIHEKIKVAEERLVELTKQLRENQMKEFNGYIELQKAAAAMAAGYDDEMIKKMCCDPLQATTDALQLKELEERFPGATMVLSTYDAQYEIAYKEEQPYGNIYCKKIDTSAPFFRDFGAGHRPQLMAEWNGLYIDLSHLF
jgi:hypothetical protein